MNKANKKQEFLELMEKNQRMVHYICNAYTYNTDDYQDLFQEILLQLWKSFDSFENLSKFSTWMYRVALNTAISNIRKDKNRKNNFDFDLPHDIKEEETANTEDEIQMLYTAIGNLGKIDKAIILLYLEEKTYEEIADIMGISNSNVGVRISRAKTKLEKLLKPIIT